MITMHARVAMATQRPDISAKRPAERHRVPSVECPSSAESDLTSYDVARSSAAVSATGSFIAIAGSRYARSRAPPDVNTLLPATTHHK